MQTLIFLAAIITVTLGTNCSSTVDLTLCTAEKTAFDAGVAACRTAHPANVKVLAQCMNVQAASCLYNKAKKSCTCPTEICPSNVQVTCSAFSLSASLLVLVYFLQ